MDNENAFEVVNVDEEAQIITLTKSPPKSPRSPRSNRKRKYEDMQAEEIQDAPMIDLSGDAEPETVATQEPAPKKQKLTQDTSADPNVSTLSALSQSTDFSDITFQVGDQQFFGLKAIFAIKSGVFRNMLYPSSMYGQHQEIRFIEITDISAEAFKFIRDFFYDLNPEITFENVVNVLNASKLYEIAPITTQCNEFLNKIDNTTDLLSVLSQFGATNGLNTELMELMTSDKIIALLQNNGKEIIESDIFGSLPFELAQKFIESDNLGVAEDLLWNKTKHWLTSNGEELKGIIRFCRMETEFIFNEIKNCGILNDNDLCSIYEKKLGLNDECVFNCNPRFEPKPKRGGRRKSKASPKKAAAAAKEEMEVEVEEEIANAEAEEEVVEEKPATPVKRGRGRRKSKGKGGSRARSKSSKGKKKN